MSERSVTHSLAHPLTRTAWSQVKGKKGTKEKRKTFAELAEHTEEHGAGAAKDHLDGKPGKKTKKVKKMVKKMVKKTVKEKKMVKRKDLPKKDDKVKLL